MKKTIQNDVPRCPECSALMSDFVRHLHRYFMCHDCGALYVVVGIGKAENEIIVSDSESENIA